MPATDLAYLERLYRGDHVRIAAWVGLFLEEFPGQCFALSSCADRNDLGGLAALAHELKPQAHYLGAAGLMQAIEALTGSATAGDAATCTEAVRAFRRAGEDVLLELRARYPRSEHDQTGGNTG